MVQIPQLVDTGPSVDPGAAFTAGARQEAGFIAMRRERDAREALASDIKKIADEIGLNMQTAQGLEMLVNLNAARRSANDAVAKQVAAAEEQSAKDFRRMAAIADLSQVRTSEGLESVLFRHGNVIAEDDFVEKMFNRKTAEITRPPSEQIKNPETGEVVATVYYPKSGDGNTKEIIIPAERGKRFDDIGAFNAYAAQNNMGNVAGLLQADGSVIMQNVPAGQRKLPSDFDSLEEAKLMVAKLANEDIAARVENIPGLGVYRLVSMSPMTQDSFFRKLDELRDLMNDKKQPTPGTTKDGVQKDGTEPVSRVEFKNGFLVPVTPPEQ